MKTVLVIEDDARIRATVRRVLARDAWYELAAEIGTAAGGIALARVCKPDLILLDLCLPDGTGADVLRAVRSGGLAAIVLVLTMLDDAEHMFDALHAGANGYLLKEQLGRRLIPALDTASGRRATPSVPTGRGAATSSTPPGRSADGQHLALTLREREVTDLLARGASYEAIGSTLGVSTNTVRSFIRKIYEKLGVCSKTGAVREAVRLGYVRMPGS